MYRISLNTAISNFRKSSKRIFRTSFSDAVFQIPDPELFSLENENIVALQKAISELNTIEKAVIVLYLEEKTYEEIAAILGITNQTLV